MRKSVGLLLGFVLAGAVAYGLHFSDGAKLRASCGQLEELCGAPADECVASMREAPPAEIAELERCVMPATSCLETVGCAAGGALRQLGKGALRGLTEVGE